MTEITVTVKVAKGDTCLDTGAHHTTWCNFYKGKACILFNKVIRDKGKCPECKALTQ